jgi:uncharacterized protein YggE
MKKLFLILLFVLPALVLAQHHTPTSQLEVTGAAQLAIAPDTGVLNISLSHIEMQFGKAITGLEKKAADIKAQIEKIGFSKDDIMTDNFQVRKNTLYRNNRQIDSGYVATQQVHLEFKNTVSNLSKILTQFSESASEFDLNFSFKLSDPLKETVQDRLIKLAVEDAFKKAELISAASKTSLQKVIRIQYGNSFNPGLRAESDMMNLKVASAMSEGFSPSDQVFSGSILVVWGLE